MSLSWHLVLKCIYYPHKAHKTTTQLSRERGEREESVSERNQQIFSFYINENMWEIYVKLEVQMPIMWTTHACFHASTHTHARLKRQLRVFSLLSQPKKIKLLQTKKTERVEFKGFLMCGGKGEQRVQRDQVDEMTWNSHYFHLFIFLNSGNRCHGSSRCVVLARF